MTRRELIKALALAATLAIKPRARTYCVVAESRGTKMYWRPTTRSDANRIAKLVKSQFPDLRVEAA